MTDMAVKEFWDKQALVHGADGHATAPDHHYRSLEIGCILKAIGRVKNATILDVGCGNGFATMQIAKRFPEASIIGVDYSEPMIAEADKLRLSNVDFMTGDVLALCEILGGNQFDVVLSTRCLINLKTWKEQMAGIIEMHARMKSGGRLLLVENLMEGFGVLNKLRGKFGLPAITVPWHNRYLQMDELIGGLSELPLIPELIENIGNLYYIASRVIYAKMCHDEGKRPDYNHPINAIAAELPTLGDFYGCSPNYLFLLKDPTS